MIKAYNSSSIQCAADKTCLDVIKDAPKQQKFSVKKITDFLMNNATVLLPQSNDNLVENSMSKVTLSYDFINVRLNISIATHGYAPKYQFDENIQMVSE